MRHLQYLILLIIIVFSYDISNAQEIAKKPTYLRTNASIPYTEYQKYFRENSNGQVKREYIHDGKNGPVSRTYQVYIPEDYTAEKEYPVIILLHEAGRTGVSLVQKWMPLADSAGLVLLGPTYPGKDWEISLEEANIIEGMIDHLDEKVNIDRSRLYLFGHLSGGHFASYMTILKQNLFAAIAVHSGYLLNHKIYFQVDYLKRRTPIIFMSGMSNKVVPLNKIKESAKFLADQGHDAMYVEYTSHNHWYYTIANELKLQALTFMSQFKNSEE